MKRRRERERDEADAREQADARREALLAELRARQAEPPPAGAATAEESAAPSAEPAGVAPDAEGATEPE